MHGLFDGEYQVLATQDVRWEDLERLPHSNTKIGHMLRHLAAEWSEGTINRLYGDTAPRMGTVYAFRDDQHQVWIAFTPRHSQSVPGFVEKTASYDRGFKVLAVIKGASMGYSYKRGSGTKFADFMNEIEAEANAESPGALLELAALKEHFAYERKRVAAKGDKKEKKPESRTDGTKKKEVTKAISAVEAAIDAVLDCAPAARDYQDDGGYDSKAFRKAVDAHNNRCDALHDILTELNQLFVQAKD